MAHDFDEAAQSYDTVFSFSEIGKAQRDRVYTQLKKYVLSSQLKENTVKAIFNLNNKI